MSNSPPTGGGEHMQSRFDEFIRKAREQLEDKGEVSLLTSLEMLGHIALLEKKLGILNGVEGKDCQ